MATITNQAALSYNGITTLSNIAVGELVEVLTVTKTAADETYTAGGVKTFAISLVNASAAALTGLTVTDTLGSYTFGANTLYPLTYSAGSLLYYVNGVLQATPTVAADAGDELVITDTFDPILKNLAVRFNGAAWTEGVHYTYDAVTGAFATVVGALTVPAATFTQDAATGVFTVDPGTSELVITGTL